MRRKNKIISAKPILLVVIVISLLFLLTPVLAEEPSIEWSKTYGGPGHDSAYSGQQTNDGGYILAGGTLPSGAGFNDIYLVKTDSDGNEEWNKTYGGSGSEVAWSVQQTSDDGYIIAGLTQPLDQWNSYIIKTDSEGNEQWSKEWGIPFDDEARSVQQTSDGGYIIVGRASKDIYLTKIDADGNELWSKTYDHPGPDIAHSVQQTSDGGYIVTGNYVIKTDGEGNEIWSKTLDGHTRSVQQTSEGGYIFAGVTSAFGAGGEDFYLVKTDSDGNEQWSKAFGGSETEDGGSAHQTLDGGYIIAGRTFSFGAGGGDIWLVKTDSMGNHVGNMTLGGSDMDDAGSVQQTDDGGYVVAGITKSFGAGESDFYLVKLSKGWPIPPSTAPPPTILPQSTVVPTTIPSQTTLPPSTALPTTTPPTTIPITTSPPKTQPSKVTETSSKSTGSSFGWIFLIALIIVVAAFSKRGKEPEESKEKKSTTKPRLDTKLKDSSEEEIKQTYITEKETETVTTKERKIPVFISKKLPTNCPKCGSPFKGKSGDACEYCGSMIRAEDKIDKAE